MGNNIFVTCNKVPPSRWKLAFPDARILPILPSDIPNDSVVWLHNFTPAQLPGGVRPQGARFVVMYDNPGDEDGLRALAQGAAGYCNAHATPELFHTIESVIKNQGLWVGESLLNRLIGGIRARSPMLGRDGEQKALETLSQREKAVALCVAHGESNKEIARQLNLAERTIKAHLTSVFEKLGVRDRLQLALMLNNPDE